jgi:glycosidase
MNARPKGKNDSLRNAAFYQIFIRNFTEKGDFAKATEYLPGLAHAGIDIIYLAPIHPIGLAARKGSLGSPYTIKDYTKIDPDLGTEEDFDAFIFRARENGLKSIMDIVFNHCSPDSKIAIERPEWCLRDAGGKPSRKVEDWSDVVDLNFANPGLRAALIDTLSFWRDKGVEGFRCDVAPLVPIDFWAEARAKVDPGREMIWLAETVHPRFVKSLRDKGFSVSSDPEIHSVFDLSYDYDGWEYLESYFAGRLPLDFYMKHLSVQETLYPAGALKLRYLENHDLQRAAAILGRGNRLANWTSFCQLLPGAFLAYMGQELALESRPSLFERDPIDRSSGEGGFEPFFFASLAAAKRIKTECGLFTAEKLAEGLLKLTWKAKPGAPAARYSALVNLEGRCGSIELKEPISGMEILSGKEKRLSGRVEIPSAPLIIEEE